jgi:hypothetical protein
MPESTTAKPQGQQPMQPGGLGSRGKSDKQTHKDKFYVKNSDSFNYDPDRPEIPGTTTQTQPADEVAQRRAERDDDLS